MIGELIAYTFGRSAGARAERRRTREEQQEREETPLYAEGRTHRVDWPALARRYEGLAARAERRAVSSPFAARRSAAVAEAARLHARARRYRSVRSWPPLPDLSPPERSPR